MSWPTADTKAAEVLGSALRALEYTEDAIDDLLGDEGRATGDRDVPVHDRRLPSSPLATAIRVFLLQLEVPRDDLELALGTDGMAAAIATGIVAAVGDRIVPNARLLPVEGLLLAFDGFPRGANDPEAYVAAYTPTASWLAALTPRRRVERALDVGTGNGIHALLAARHSDHVIATDVNERALAYAALNAALNGMRNVEVRHGSLFEPVAGERFDLITCNAPYVVSPETKWQYRDSGLPADEVSERVVKQAAAALADDGFAAMLVSWVGESEEVGNAHIEQWLEGCGADAWVLDLSGADPLDHAAGWNEHLADDPAVYGAALDEWTSYFDQLGVGWITEAAVILHRRDAAIEHTTRFDEVDEEELEFASEQIERAFAARAFLDRVRDPKALLDVRLALVPDARLEHVQEPSGDVEDTRFVLDEGTQAEFELDLDTADVLTALDGRLTLGQSVDRVARQLELSRAETTELRRSAIEAAQELLELGFADLT